jgi:hypothetical protein
MSRKVFTAGEVLAAADVNSFLMDQTVMSFAGTAARGSAIPSPVEGMYTHIEDIDSLQFYNGSAFVPATGMTLIKSQDVGSGVANTVVADVFSANFDAYQIIWSGGNGNTANTGLSMFLGTATADYYTAGIFGGGGGSGGLGNTGTPQSSASVGEIDANSARCSFRLVDPFAARYTMIVTDAALNLTNFNTRIYGHVNLTNTSFTSFTLFPNAGTMSSGTIRVYGYRKN